MNKIAFNIDGKVDWLKNYNLNNMTDEQRLQYDASFTILINGKMYFNDPYFPIFDFMYCINTWLKSSGRYNMMYNCIETEDNPLISFLHCNDKWYIYSPWENFSFDGYFSFCDLKYAIQEFKQRLFLT